MKLGFSGDNYYTWLRFDLKVAFPINDHPLIYRDKIVVLSPAVSLEAEEDRITLIPDAQIPDCIKNYKESTTLDDDSDTIWECKINIARQTLSATNKSYLL